MCRLGTFIFISRLFAEFECLTNRLICPCIEIHSFTLQLLTSVCFLKRTENKILEKLMIRHKISAQVPNHQTSACFLYAIQYLGVRGYTWLNMSEEQRVLCLLPSAQIFMEIHGNECTGFLLTMRLSFSKRFKECCSSCHTKADTVVINESRLLLPERQACAV